MERSLNKANRILLLFALLVYILFQFASCKKEPPSSNPNLFLRTYQTDSSAVPVYIEQLADGGFMIISSEGAGRPLLIRTDKFGKQTWQKTIQKYCFPNNYIEQIVKSQDGKNYIAQFGWLFTKFDTIGNIEKNKSLSKTEYSFVGAMVHQGSNIIVSAINNPQINKIYVFDEDFTQLRADSFYDTRSGYGGVTAQFFANSMPSSGDYIIVGDKFPNNKMIVPKLFAARIPVPGKIFQSIVDSADLIYSDQISWQTSSSDSGIILLGSRFSPASYNTYPVVVKFDKNLKKVWVKDFPLYNGSIYTSKISLCKDGGYMILGQVGKTGYQDTKPYVLKIDASGNKQWDKTILSSSGSGELLYCASLNDGSYAFVGYSNQFGNGLNNANILFIKTDASGNY